MNVKYEGKDLEAMSFAHNYHTWVLSKFRPYLGKAVAEVGAGSGNVTTMLLGQGVEELVAVEPSDEMYPLLTQKFHSMPQVVSIHALFADIYQKYIGHFDSVVYVNVMEHVEHEQQELQYIQQALKPCGHVCIFVPALPWLYSEFDASIGHYRRYTKKYIKTLLVEAGFEIVTLSYFDVLGIIPWLIVFTLFKKKLSSGNTALYDGYVVPFSRILESVFPVPIGKNILVVARKK